MTLFWHSAGPRLRYERGVLHIEDLNPEVKTRWTMSRGELLKLALRCIVAAFRENQP